jgi:malonate decarboxylase delta subunit
METLKFNYPHATRPVNKRAHVGIVGSGDMEVLIVPSTVGAAEVTVLTSVDGFGVSWRAVFDRFFSSYEGAVRIHVNDAGATPGSVMLRLLQAVEVIES